ncbi:MAG: DUF928 domain-containing protein [Cyanophyceae cyanobacterium]
MKTVFPFLSFNLFLWALTIYAPPSLVWAQSDSGSFLPLMSAASQRGVDFSGTGRPGRQTAGDSRDLCPTFNSRLTALMPDSHWGKTVSEHPTFWFYLPYSRQQVPVGEFVLQDEERNDVYRTAFTVPDKQGYVSISLPSEASLEMGRWYQWYFKVYCDPQRNSSPIFVHGWVQRIALDPSMQSELAAATPRQDVTYAARGIWYDALMHLANLRLTYPEDAALQEDWHHLLQSKGVSLEVPRSEMVGSVEVAQP